MAIWIHTHGREAFGGAPSTDTYANAAGAAATPSRSDHNHAQSLTVATTFATANVTMTAANTFFTAVTLGSPLVAGGSYLLMGNIVINDVSVANSRFTVEIRDTTNNVTIASIDSQNTVLNDVSAIAIPPVVYSGYAGTPTIVIRSESSGGTTDVVIAAAAGTGATANKQTYITAVRVA